MKTISKKICKYSEHQNTNIIDFIAVEKPIEIRLGHDSSHFQTLSITLATPVEIEDLIRGYLFTENIITTHNDIIKITVFDNELILIAEIILTQSINFTKHLDKRHGMIHASCGICGKTSLDDLLTYKYPNKNNPNKTIDAKIISQLPQKLKDMQKGFAKTGGLHASALFSSQGELLLLREDIGRHNALDKLIGAAMKKDLLPINNQIILLSGRVSFELVHKALMASTSVVCAIGAPSSLCIEIAQLNHLTLYGFVNAKSFNRYTF